MFGADGRPVGPENRADHRVLVPTVAVAPGRPPSDRLTTLDGRTMGTTWAVRAYAPPGLGEADLRAAIEAELDAVILLFSPWDPRSEVSRFNAAPAGTWALSQPFWSLLTAAMDVADDTNGAVDPTLGAMVDLWGFGPPGPRDPLLPTPSEDEIEAALALSGWQGFRLNRDARAAVQPGGLKLDFSAIAKGHAVDRVSDRLTALGVTSHLVDIGGELKGRGVKPDAQPWWVEIEQPPLPEGAGDLIPCTVAALYDLAVATSGDYRKGFVHEGRLYSHTVDRRTGRPVDNGLAAVTVLHASAQSADALATALMVMGPYEGREFAEAIGLAARLVERTPRGPNEVMTPAWTAMLDEGEG